MSFLKRLFSSKNDKGSNQTGGFSEGDVFYTHFNGQYHVHKLLAVDDDLECYHILTYQPIDTVPAPADVDKLDVFVYHSPFDKKVFSNAVFLIKKPIKADDLIGYHEYLRQTQEPEYYVPIANEYYKNGCSLADEKKHLEAIDSYSKAIDLFPQFFEAIDNRAFCKMDLGLWIEAIDDFRLSLEQNPSSMLAEFSMGECYFKIGDLQKAKSQFEIAEKLDPAHPAPKEFLIKIKNLSSR